MANVSQNLGLIPVADGGKPFDGGHIKCYVPATDSVALFKGDIVKLIATGTGNTAAVKTAIAEHRIGTLPTIQRAVVGDTPGTGDVIFGVIIGFEPTVDRILQTTTSGKNHRVASTEAVVKVVPARPGQLYRVRDDGAAALTAAAVGLNAVLIETTNNTTTGVSGVRLDTNSDVPAADASNQLLIRSFEGRIDNAMGAFGVWLVEINQPYLGSAGVLGQ